MSYILDALKKSEKERQLQKVPDLFTADSVAPPRRRTPRLLWLLSLALLVNAGVFAFWFFSGERVRPQRETGMDQAGSGELTGREYVRGGSSAGGSTAPAGSVPPSAVSSVPASGGKGRKLVAAEARKAESAVAGPPPSSPAVAPVANPEAVPSPAPAATDPGRAPSPVVETPSAVEGVALGEDEGAVGPQPDGPEQPVAAEKEVDPQHSSVPAVETTDQGPPPVSETGTAEPVMAELSGLPLSLRREIPELSISIHLYSEDPSRRKAGINGRLRRQGETVAEGLVLEEITPDGVILSWKGRRFHLGVF